MSTLIERVRDMPGRTKVFIAVGLLLLILGVTGRLQASQDLEITRDQAIEMAREHVDFEPVNADARLVRQGFSLVPVWAVSFSIPSEDSRREFERLTTVEINAESGEVIRISVDNLGLLTQITVQALKTAGFRASNPRPDPAGVVQIFLWRWVVDSC